MGKGDKKKTIGPLWRKLSTFRAFATGVCELKIPANFEPCGLKFHNPTDFKLQKHFGPIVHWASRLVYLQIVMSYHQKNLGVAKGFQNNFQNLKLILNPERGNFTTN